MRIENLKNKKIAIVGLGANNRGLANYLRAKNIPFDAIESWSDPAQLIGRLDDFEIIFRTPGLPYTSVAIQQAKQKGAEILSQTKLFFELCPSPIIAVTGTKGKGTTSSLIAKILEASGKKVWLGGNIGRDPFEFLDQMKEADLAILELSSFQLQDLEKSPHVAVVLSITPDHLDHHKTMDEYIKAKSNILAFQKPEDFAVLHPSLPDWFKDVGLGKKVFIDPASVKQLQRKLLGDHNLENIAAAAAVAKIYKIGEEVIKKAVAEFQPLPHRLQVVARKNNITYVDDSISTNEDSTIAAVNAFSQPLIVILGGSSKGLDYSRLGEALKNSNHLKAAVLVGEVAPVILKALDGYSGKILTGARNMEEIVRQAQSASNDGDVILLSPAAASFDMFKSYKDRGEQFINCVEKL